MSSNVFETEFNIRSSYSPSNSFMVFVPPLNYPQNVECHSNLTVKLYFTAEKEEITFNVHYIVSLSDTKYKNRVDSNLL